MFGSGRGRLGNTGKKTSAGGAHTPIGQTGSLSSSTTAHGYSDSGRGTLGHTGDKNSLGTGAGMGDAGSQSSSTTPHNYSDSGRGRTGNTGDKNSLGSGRGPGQTGSLAGLAMAHGSYGSGRGTLGNTGNKDSLGTGAGMGDSGSQSGGSTSTAMHGGPGMGFAASPFNPVRFSSSTSRVGIPKKQKGAAGGASMHGLKAAAKTIAGHGNDWKAKKGTNTGTGTTTTGPMADSPSHYNGGKG